ncbi:bifunctional DNA-formamidopyrimidine glycosylase/DNA-(apurinic or apyrimidinic site) lyase [Hyphobacterium sp. CCMP332]|uniref:bifunctional DNA-formamidopyrimidine glycosylase/DNA-(apurinic or apyrimidinic site) lyase n=1 Tax=Hyphobacterium sp. CCMP332 TaxID=2749086 RepID=UPI00164F0142|nr:bifunctional DNA-formamidopyrimidine glycosylase/DNA-(apurinic or apyrimidinic site) lyase [Hyphobacterium sp. CCMP332]QNL19814.1 bifunctional DNA-formamidopyrimidine glycosylase/DNA-(apurinic or apyrimidinic site) lyase [Hyphobacterium sp. CCMP332]
MPELPEVETVRKGLAPVMEGRLIERAENRRPDLRFPFPDGFAERLTGIRVERLDRRAKYLLFRLESGETLLAHLGMSGRFTIQLETQTEKPGSFAHAPGTSEKHDHVVFGMEGGASIVFNDPRRFGFMTLFPTDHEAAVPFLAGLGPEPNSNEFSGPFLQARVKGKKAPLKAALLDQRVVAGLGNIYVCEALHRAGLSPRRMAGTLGPQRAERLALAVRQVIDEAIAAGGSSLKDFASADGELGYFQHTFRAYGQEGQVCVTAGCGGVIERIVQSGRSTFFCPTCQR